MLLQCNFTTHNCIAYVTVSLVLTAFVDIANVHSKCVGFDKLFWTNRTLVLELWIMFHFVSLELVKTRNNSGTNRTSDTESFLSLNKDKMTAKNGDFRNMTD